VKRQRVRIYVWNEQSEGLVEALHKYARDLGLSMTELATIALYFGLECIRPPETDEEKSWPSLTPR